MTGYYNQEPGEFQKITLGQEPPAINLVYDADSAGITTNIQIPQGVQTSSSSLLISASSIGDANITVEASADGIQYFTPLKDINGVKIENINSIGQHWILLRYAMWIRCRVTGSNFSKLRVTIFI